MKAHLIEDATNFKRGQETIKGLDAGIQRSDNPKNFANAKSYKIDLTNEEFLNQIQTDLDEFNMSLGMDMSPMPEDENIAWPIQNKEEIGILRGKMNTIENSIEDLIDFLKTVKR